MPHTLPILAFALFAPAADLPAAVPSPIFDRARLVSAVERGLKPLEVASKWWTDNRDCTSCHHQALGSMTFGTLRELGYAVDEAILRDQIDAMMLGNDRIREALLQGEGVIDGQISVSYEMAAFAASGEPATALTDTMFHYLAGKQAADGGWLSESHRPPLEDSEFTATALTARAIGVYAPEGRMKELDSRLERCRQWLLVSKPDDNEDRAMRLLGLGWARATGPEKAAVAAELIALQRPDGGWAQIDSAPASDAYATGQTLVALNQAAGVPTSHPAYRRGVEWLLAAQKDDGSWHVPTRRKTQGQRYFDAYYPHGVDQFISYCGGAWGTIALALAADPRQELAPTAPLAALAGRALSPSEPHVPDEADPVEDTDSDGVTALMRAVVSGTADDVRKCLAKGSNPNAASSRGVTALHCAVFDAEKTRLLLEAGADIAARTELGYTASILAGGYDGAFDAMVDLFERESEIDEDDPMNESSALFLAAVAADVKKVRWLYERGADPNVGIEQGFSALSAAVNLGRVEIVAALLDLGAEMSVSSGRRRGSPLSSAAMHGFTDVAKLLVGRGADVNARDGEGRTALHWAALLDPGHVRIVDALLSAGAAPLAAAKDGATPLDVATKHGHTAIAERLRAAIRPTEPPHSGQ